MHHRRVALLTLLLAVAALVLALPAGAQAAVTLQKVGDFDAPIFITAAPGDPSRLYVVERGGTVQVVRNGVKLGTPFLGLGGVNLDGERGLLSIAFPPDFQTSHFFYAYFNNDDGDIEVDQLRAIDGDRADPGYRHTVIKIPHPGASNHNGGTAIFGRDGHLYMATGDGGTGGGNARDPNSRLGKVLRIDPRPGGGYTVPADNPHAGGGGAAEVWAFGLRNPFRFTIDPFNGDLMIADVGEGTTEEIDWAQASSGGGRGADYGWNLCEGSFVTGSSTTPCGLGTKPVIDQFADDGWHSIIAGYVVRDTTLPSLQGRFLYGDESLGKIYSARLAKPQAQDKRFLMDLDQLVAFTVGANGCTYAASLGGPVYRLTETGAPNCLPPFVAVQDKTAPRLRTKTKRRQRVLRQRGVIGYVRCPTEACRVSMSGRVRIGKLSYPLHKVTKRDPRNKRLKLRVKLTKRAKANLKRARKRHKRAIVDVAYRARDGAGNRSRLGRVRVRVTG
jgi:glucose/arabinose dehydrogenase